MRTRDAGAAAGEAVWSLRRSPWPVPWTPRQRPKWPSGARQRPRRCAAPPNGQSGFIPDCSLGRGMAIPRHCEGRRPAAIHGAVATAPAHAAMDGTGLPRPCGARNDGFPCSGQNDREPPANARVGAQHRLMDNLGLLFRFHSCRSASIGSSRAARRAGK